jgi:hypothetical protein
MELLIGIALGIPIGIVIKIWLDGVATDIFYNGWR